MSTPHAIHMGKQLAELGMQIEQAIHLAGTRGHFYLVVWTNDMEAEHVMNSDHRITAEVLRQMAELLDGKHGGPKPGVWA